MLVRILFLSSLVILPNLSYAKATLEAGFKGTISITSPDGKVTLLEPGETIPEIAPNSTLEVFGGSFALNAQETDNIKLICLNHQASLKGNGENSVTLSCGEDSGLLHVTKGSANVIDPAEKELVVTEGKEFPIYVKSAKTGGATGADDSVGSPSVGGNLGDEPPVDGHDIETSPFK